MAPKSSSKREMHFYSWKEVALHNTPPSMWICVRDKVYDVTHFEHPGGRDVLLLNSGRDATMLFEAYHPLSVFGLLGKYEIGELSSSEHPSYPPMSPFYRTLKERVARHFAGRGTTGKTSASYVLISLLLVLTFLGGYHVALRAGSPWFYVPFAALAGWMGALISLIPVHEASHCALTHKPWAWRTLGAVHDLVNGASFYSWLHQHFLGHHPYTNVEGVDPDIHTNDPDLRRIKASQAWLPRYRWQWLYAPVAYGLLAAKFRLQDLVVVCGTRMNGAIRVNPPPPFYHAVFWVGKLWFVAYRFVLPPLLLGTPVWQVCVVGMVADLVTSYYLAIAFQVNHVVGEAEFFRAARRSEGERFERDVVELDWATSQVVSTVDYAHSSRLTTFLTGALNMQAVHHLFPGVSQAHYMEIAPIVRQACEEFNVPYTVLPDFYTAFCGHIRYLQNLGKVHQD